VLRLTFHAGDGNLHPLMMFEANDLKSFRKAELLTGSDGVPPAGADDRAANGVIIRSCGRI
jgi:hypothetical protein